ncbi:hypothetical protein FZI27_20230 [Cronobacter sakazakii]|nr:hypothetical protein FZI27_20230 [Cronobacter sakazakii]
MSKKALIPLSSINDYENTLCMYGNRKPFVNKFYLATIDSLDLQIVNFHWIFDCDIDTELEEKLIGLINLSCSLYPDWEEYCFFDATSSARSFVRGEVYIVNVEHIISVLSEYYNKTNKKNIPYYEILNDYQNSQIEYVAVILPLYVSLVKNESGYLVAH